MPAFRIDLRFRIAAVLAAVCIMVVSGLGFALYLASEKMQETVEAQIVSDEMESLIQRAQRAPELVAKGPSLQYYVLRSRADYEALPAAFRELGPGHHQIGRDVEEVRVAMRDVDGVRYVVVYNAGPHEARQARFRNLLLLALAAVVVIALALGYWLAGVLTWQLTDLAKRVGRLAPDEPHAALERADHDREVGALARALDNYQARIVDMMKRAQEFTANTSHELRTPLTAIKTSCELLAAEPGLNTAVQARIAMIERAAEQMTECMQALLILARRHQPAGAQKVALRQCVDQAAQACRDEMARKGVAFEVTIPDGEVVEADHAALRLVLANLIKNAGQYTDRGYIRVSYQPPRLTVADSGSGIAEHHLPRLFERYYRAGRTDEGLGLGLAIVERICDHFGWKIEVRSSPGAGSAFTLVLA
jgi:signal transduction histidine kinase